MDSGIAGQVQHPGLAAGRWHRMSLAEQLGNIGSEVGRAARWREKDPRLFESAAIRALELMDLTLCDSRWKYRLKELARLREIFCDAVWGDGVHRTSLADLEKYLYPFAFAARNR